MKKGNIYFLKFFNFFLDLDKAAQKRKNQLQHLRKLPSFRTLKKKAQGPTLEEMLNAPCYKQNLLQIFSNGKWKDR